MSVNCVQPETWLAGIPSRWRLLRLKYLSSCNDEVLSENTSKNQEIKYIDIGSVSNMGEIGSTETMLFVDAPSRARRVVRHGDVLISTVRTYLKAIAPIKNPPDNFIASTGFAVVRHGSDAAPGYLAYALRTDGFVGEVISRSVGVSYPAINSTDLMNITIPAPPLEEQTQIAKFLDYETAKIDALTAKQQQLIALLHEKRQAVISHAVTKGLNPAAPLRDSGVAWLGAVPAHWEVVPLKRFIEFQRGHDLPTEERREGNYPVVSSAGSIGTHDDYRCKGPGIVTGRYGTIGEFYYVPKDFWPLNTSLYSINCHGNDERFLLYMLRNMKHIFVLNSLKAAVPGVDRNDVHSEYVAAPQKPQEQQAIANYLDDRMSRFDDLTRIAEQAVALLQERRTALISAAVTGKIDVRGWQPPLANPAGAMP